MDQLQSQREGSCVKHQKTKALVSLMSSKSTGGDPKGKTQGLSMHLGVAPAPHRQQQGNGSQHSSVLGKHSRDAGLGDSEAKRPHQAAPSSHKPLPKTEKSEGQPTLALQPPCSSAPGGLPAKIQEPGAAGAQQGAAEVHGVSSSHEGGGAGGGEGAVQPQQPRRLARTISTPSRYQDGILDVSLPGKKGGDDHHGSRREAPAAAEPAATAPPPVRPVVPPPEAKPQQQPQVPEGPPVCCFCHRPADEEAICGLGMLQQTKETVLDRKKNVVHLYYHEPCAAYGGGMGAIPTTLMDVEDDVIREWQRGNALHCVHCKSKKVKPVNRATMGCIQQNCRVSLHYPCARELAAEQKVFFAQGPREIICQKHKAWYLKMKSKGGPERLDDALWLEDQWLGMWMEGSGGWNGGKMQSKAMWEANNFPWPESAEQAHAFTKSSKASEPKGAELQEAGNEIPARAEPRAELKARAPQLIVTDNMGGTELKPGPVSPLPSGSPVSFRQGIRSQRSVHPRIHSPGIFGHGDGAEEEVAHPLDREMSPAADKVRGALTALDSPPDKSPADRRNSSGTYEMARVLHSMQAETSTTEKVHPPHDLSRFASKQKSLIPGEPPNPKAPVRATSNLKPMPEGHQPPGAGPQVKDNCGETEHMFETSSEEGDEVKIEDEEGKRVNRLNPPGQEEPKKSKGKEPQADWKQQPQPPLKAASKPQKNPPAAPKETGDKKQKLKQKAVSADSGQNGRAGGGGKETGHAKGAEGKEDMGWLDCLALFAVEEWRKIRLAIRSVPMQSGVTMFSLSLSKTMASSLQPSLKWWQEEISPSGLTTHVIGWDYAAWATGISFAAEERAAVEAAMDRYMRPYVKMRSAGQPLPEELPVCNKVEACYIPKTDPRRALHGQEGLEATSFIPRGTVIGPVKGTLMTVAEYHKWKYSSDCIPTGVQPEWWAAVHEAYHWELSNPDIGRAFPWLRDHLVVSMVRDGNSTALINDPQVNPLAYSNGLRDPEDVAKPNVHPLVVSFMGFPVLLVVAMVDILPGQELLSRYGRRYWDRVREGLCAANSVARIVDV